MEFQRTANAGGLLRLDGETILLDGVCREVFPYLATPALRRSSLPDERIGLYAFTHDHADHFDPDYHGYRSAATVVGTAEVAAALPGVSVCESAVSAGAVKVTPVATRHMGKVTQAGHYSYVLEGSSMVWFMGDASPIELEKLKAYSRPDVLIVPFPYVSSPGALRKVQALNPQHLIVVHMPLRDIDPDALWSAVSANIPQLQMKVSIPEMGETVRLSL